MALFGGFRGSIPTAPKVIEETEVQTPQGQVQSTEVLQSREPSLGGQSDVALSLSRKTEDLERSSPEQATLDPNKPFAGFSTMGTVPGVTSSTIDQGPVPTGLGKPLEAAAEGTTHIPATETIKRAGQFKEDISINQETGLSKKNLKTLQDFVGKQDMPQEMKSKFFNALIPGVLEKLSNTEGTPEFKVRQQQEFDEGETAAADSALNLFGGREIPQLDKIQLDDMISTIGDAFQEPSIKNTINATIAGGDLVDAALKNVGRGVVNTVSGLINILGNAKTNANSAWNIGQGAIDMAQGEVTPESRITKGLIDVVGEDIIEPINQLVTKGNPGPLVELIGENPEVILEAMLPGGLLSKTSKAAKVAGKTAKAADKVTDTTKIAKRADDAADAQKVSAARITDAGLKDAPSAVRALQDDIIDLSKVGDDPKILKGQIDDGIGTLAKQQDALLRESRKKFGPKNSDVVVGQGKNAQIFNPLEDAFETLEDLYSPQATNKPKELADLLDLKDKFLKGNLSAEEANKIAREYGVGTNAFSDATGIQKASTTADRAESIRKQLKEFVRENIIKGDDSKALDKRMSDLFTVQRTMQKSEDTVFEFVKRANELNFGGKAVSLVEQGGNLNLGTMMKKMFGGVTKKTLNKQEITQNLDKNIKKFTELVEVAETAKTPGAFRKATQALKDFLGTKAGAATVIAGDVAGGTQE